MGLERTQGLFFKAISSALPEDVAVVGADSNTTNDFAIIADQIVTPGPGGKLSAAERLGLYRMQYWYRLIDCLYDDFPGLRAVLGDKIFYKLVLNYLHTARSKDFNLRNLGCSMPQFVSSTDVIPKVRAKAALDMARLEWASVEAFDNASLPVIDANALRLGEVSSLRLTLQPYITLLELSYPWDQLIADLQRQERDRGEAARGEASDHGKVAPFTLPKRETIFLAVHRFNTRIFYKRVSKGAFHLLTALKSGADLNSAFEVAIPFMSKDEIDKAAETVAEWFDSWTALGWLAADIS